VRVVSANITTLLEPSTKLRIDASALMPEKRNSGWLFWLIQPHE
jgi:hypothetical protein